MVLADGEIERKGGWMLVGLRDNLKRIARWIKTRKLAILVVLVWSISVALVTIKSYLFFYYIEEPGMFEKKFVYSTGSWIPRLYEVDYLLILAMGVISGVLLVDLERIFYGWIASTFLSFFISVIFSSFFIWFTLGAGEMFSILLGWAWAVEEVSYIAIRIVFRMTFPLVQLFSFVASFVAAFLRSMIQPSATTL